MNLHQYKTLIFDCDGVILNSNSIKSRAFYDSALPYGKEAAEALLDYHIKNGGVSRYKKFEYFLHNIINRKSPDEMRCLCDSYAHAVRDGLMDCEIAGGLKDLKSCTRHSGWMLVSGGDQEELRRVFKARGIDEYFNRGIFGSPDCKEDILRRETDKRTIIKPAVYFGDSSYDYDVAVQFGIDFIFVSGGAEFKSWEFYFRDKNVRTIQYVSSVINY